MVERHSIYLYKKLTKVAQSKQLGEESTKFSIHLNKDYIQMLEEFASRTDTTRAEAARVLLSTALDEINDLYNLKNEDDFDYSYTDEMEKVLKKRKFNYYMQSIVVKTIVLVNWSLLRN